MSERFEPFERTKEMSFPLVCFIDDSPFEHDLVKNEIAPCVEDLAFVQAFTFEEMVDLLGDRRPSLFLLDLWGYDEEVEQPFLTPEEELRKRVNRFPTLEQVYEGLESFTGDANNEYLKRLFTIVDSWRSLFEEVCARIGQNRKYGISNLIKAREVYPGVPAVFYTRKSLINDAVAVFRAHADGLYIKPTGPNDEETRRLTREYAPVLVQELKKTMRGRQVGA